mgnify:CR=1
MSDAPEGFGSGLKSQGQDIKTVKAKNRFRACGVKEESCAPPEGFRQLQLRERFSQSIEWVSSPGLQNEPAVKFKMQMTAER